jgi:hypothetical protein
VTQATCADLVVGQWERTRKALKAFQNDKLTNEEECTLYEYGLSFDFVKPNTFDDQPVGYWRYQMSFGGPADEIRYHIDEDEVEPYVETIDGITWVERRTRSFKVEYWYLQWWDGASVHLSGDDKELAMWVFRHMAKRRT